MEIIIKCSDDCRGGTDIYGSPVMELVRCKDCKYYYKDAVDGYEMCDNSEGHDHVTEDGFCYWGERKDDE